MREPMETDRRGPENLNHKALALRKALGARGPARVAAVFTLFALLLSVSTATLFLTGCDDTPSTPTSSNTSASAETKPAKPAIPADVQAAAESFLGTDTEVLTFGDLTKNGKQQFLAANVVPKSPSNPTPGTVITRAVIAENSDGKWLEILRCDEHLKNPKGFLADTPLAAVTGWRLQYEQDAQKGLQLYFIPLKGQGDVHTFPIGVRWNPTVKRFQSMDHDYAHFLPETPSLEAAPSRLR
jgi:hypothetical protein